MYVSTNPAILSPETCQKKPGKISEKFLTTPGLRRSALSPATTQHDLESNKVTQRSALAFASNPKPAQSKS